MNSRVVAIVPTYNGWPTVDKCLKSLEKQTLPFKEILVVVNGSTDGSAAKISQKHPQVKIINLGKNTGVTGGRNAGIKAAKKYDYLLFFDHDMVANKNMVEELVKEGQKIEKAGILTPKIYYLSQKSRIWSAGTGINLWTGQVLFRGGFDYGQFDQIEEIQVAPAALLVKNEVIQRIKGFDTKYFATYEDTDFCFRAREKGYKTYYVPQAVAHHDLTTNPVEESKRLLNRAYWVGRNRVIFMKDFGESILVFWLFLPVYLFYYLRLSLKYGSIKNWFLYIAGTLDGITGK